MSRSLNSIPLSLLSWSSPTRIYEQGADKEVYANLIKLLSPVAPHFAEELWHILGNQESIFKAEWPKFNPEMLIEDTVTIVVQVNGKVRSKMDIPADLSEDKLKTFVLSDEKLKTWLEGKPVRNFIIVPKKLVNIVL